tara:strand:+ start:855 stop:1100 length:246 start_codon:yes stop_codon:yes gene_type:complete
MAVADIRGNHNHIQHTVRFCTSVHETSWKKTDGVHQVICPSPEIFIYEYLIQAQVSYIINTFMRHFEYPNLGRTYIQSSSQ